MARRSTGRLPLASVGRLLLRSPWQLFAPNTPGNADCPVVLPQGHRTFSLLPDFLAARLPDLLDTIEDSVAAAGSARSMEAAADCCAGPTSPCQVLSAGCAVAFAPSARGSTPSPISCRTRRLAALTRASPVCWPSFAAPWRQRFWPTFRHRSVFRPHGVPSEPTMRNQHEMGPDGTPDAHYDRGSIWSMPYATPFPQDRHSCAHPRRYAPRLACRSLRPEQQRRRCTCNGSAASAPIPRRRLDERTELTRDGASGSSPGTPSTRRLDPQAAGPCAHRAVRAQPRVPGDGASPAGMAGREACLTARNGASAGVCRSPCPSPGQSPDDHAQEAGSCRQVSEHLADTRQDLEHDGADGHRRVPGAVRAAICALDRGRHRL